MLENVSDPGKLIGLGVTGNRETELGTVDAVYLDDETGRPEWVAVTTGLFGSRVSLMPLNEAEYRDGVLHLPYTREQVRNAPHQDLDHELSPDDERRLFGHYGRDHTRVAGQDDRGGGVDTARGRSEEPLRVGVDTPRRDGVRLQRYEVTDR
ncbi:PRC-barrel domain-containing protein [Actinomycetospora sp. NBC_00405]|uniref:PRC-barrel domain-containing protein n=1 Tax=Actinomycetospora sp. NBC_00405 TaxID=2975952 RepID=UPI002E1D1866